MYVAALHLTNFRSYADVSVEFDPGINVLIGSNGQGKTNLVEAIGYVGMLTSHRVAADAPLIRRGKTRAGVDVRIRGERDVVVQLDINAGQANRAKVSGVVQQRMRDVLGLLPLVTFAPEDLALVKGDPTDRRAFLDEIVVGLTPRLAGTLADYEKVVRQRSSLLKSAGGLRGTARERALDSLFVWDERLARLGGQVRSARLAAVDRLRPHVAQAYDEISDVPGETGLAYTGEGVTMEGQEEAMLAAMAQVRDKEVDRGVCLVGPHRDDLQIDLAGGPAKGFASHGESWSLALALRLAQAQVFSERTSPILILDDVFAELDSGRRARLAALVAHAPQVFVTAAVAADVPPELSGATFHVSSGQVTRAD